VELGDDAGIALKPLSRSAARRTAEVAVAHAAGAGGRLTAVHKANVMPHTDGVFLEAVREVAAAHPAVELDDRLVDTACAELVTRPERLRVVVTTMLYGDILSDLGAALAGGLGVAPGANLGEGCAVFEAVHGTARRLAGRGVANPTAMVLSGAMLLRHAGHAEAAERVERAVAAVVAEGRRVTYDLRADRDEERAASTEEMADAIAAAVATA
jgi:isocitrate dehydrogenase (NAD+)